MILTHACPFIVSSPVIVTTLFAAKLYSRSFGVRGSFRFYLIRYTCKLIFVVLFLPKYESKRNICPATFYPSLHQMRISYLNRQLYHLYMLPYIANVLDLNILHSYILLQHVQYNLLLN